MHLNRFITGLGNYMQVYSHYAIEGWIVNRCLYLWINGISRYITLRIYRSVRNAIVGSGNGLSPVRHTGIIWTNNGMVLFDLMDKYTRNMNKNNEASVETEL